jgi:tol-pal system protein YbgF
MNFSLKNSLSRLIYFFISIFLIIFSLLSIVATSETQAQSQENINAILDRMGRLENDIRNLNISISRGVQEPASSQLSKTSSVLTTKIKPPNVTLQSNKIEPVSSHAMARLSVQIAELENDLRSVTGAMEKFNFQVGNLTNRMDKLVADIDYRLSLLEGRVPGAQNSMSEVPKVSPAPLPPSVQKINSGETRTFASQPGVLGTVSQSSIDALVLKKSVGKPSESSSSSIAQLNNGDSIKKASELSKLSLDTKLPAITRSFLPKGTAEQQYNYAFKLLGQGKYDKAEKALQEFVVNNSEDKLAVNARYWLGETFYVRAAYVQAAEVFLEGYQADPKGKKAAGSLLKLGMSLSGIDKKREACSAFDKVIKDFPNISKRMRETISKEKKKNSCS